MTAAAIKAKTKNLAIKKNKIIAKDKPKNILNGLMIIFLWLMNQAILIGLYILNCAFNREDGGVGKLL